MYVVAGFLSAVLTAQPLWSTLYKSQYSDSIYLTIYFCVNHLMVLDGEWIHGTCQGEEVCNVMTLVEDMSVHQYLS